MSLCCCTVDENDHYLHICLGIDAVLPSEKDLVMGMIKQALDGVDPSGHHQHLQALHPGASPPVYSPSFDQSWRKPQRTRLGVCFSSCSPFLKICQTYKLFFVYLHSSHRVNRAFNVDKPGNYMCHSSHSWCVFSMVFERLLPLAGKGNFHLSSWNAIRVTVCSFPSTIKSIGPESLLIWQQPVWWHSRCSWIPLKPPLPSPVLKCSFWISLSYSFMVRVSLKCSYSQRLVGGWREDATPRC